MHLYNKKSKVVRKEKQLNGNIYIYIYIYIYIDRCCFPQLGVTFFLIKNIKNI